jgi:two-component system sensor histidine kinase KdpD
VLLDAGIDIFTTMNVQHIESLNDKMREIAGVEVRETVPDWVVKRADELVLVDIPPQALLNRLKRGAVYAPEKARQAAENFFKEHILAALRELTIRQAAHEVDVRQDETSTAPSSATENAYSAPAPDAAQYGPETLLIHVTEAPSTAALIRRGRRVADYLRGECFAVCILPSADLDALETPAKESIERHLDFARRLRIETRLLAAHDQAQALVDFARRNGVTQIFVAKPEKQRLSFLALRDFVMKVVRLASDMQVSVVSERRHTKQ